MDRDLEIAKRVWLALAALIAAVLVGLLFSGCQVFPAGSVQDEYVSIVTGWEQRVSYVFVARDGRSYAIDLPLSGRRADGCYHLYPPSTGEEHGTAIRFADVCPAATAQSEGPGD